MWIYFWILLCSIDLCVCFYANLSMSQTYGSCGHKPIGLQIGYLGVWLSDAGVKSRGAWCGVWTLHSEKLWVLSFLLIMVGFVVRLYLSLSCPLGCGFPLICTVRRGHSARFWLFFRGNCSMCSCRLNVSVGGKAFRIFLCHPLELELDFLVLLISFLI